MLHSIYCIVQSPESYQLKLAWRKMKPCQNLRVEDQKPEVNLSLKLLFHICWRIRIYMYSFKAEKYLGDDFFRGFFTLGPWGSLESQIGRIPSAPTSSSTTETLFLSISWIRVKNGSHKFQKCWKLVTHCLLHCIRNQQTLSLKSQTKKKKNPDSKYFRLCLPYWSLPQLPNVTIVGKSKHKRYENEWQ